MNKQDAKAAALDSLNKWRIVTDGLNYKIQERKRNNWAARLFGKPEWYWETPLTIFHSSISQCNDYNRIDKAQHVLKLLNEVHEWKPV